MGVPIKKRPVVISDNASLRSGTESLMEPSPSGPESSSRGSHSLSSPGRSALLSSRKGIEGKGTNLSRDLNMVSKNNSSVPLSTEKKRGPLNGSADLRAHEKSDRGDFASAGESQGQKSPTSKLQFGSLVKEERVDQFSSGVPLPAPPVPIPPSSYSNPNPHSISNNGKTLPDLDLNVPLDPVDYFDDPPTMLAGNSELCQRTNQNLTFEVRKVVPDSVVRSGTAPILNTNLNLSSFKASHSSKDGRADVTLDLQLKLPTRPELGINWKSIGPPPELSLSLFGKHLDVPPSAVVKSEPVDERLNKSRAEVATPALEKQPIEKVVKHEPCDVGLQKKATTSVGPRNLEMASDSSGLKRKLPEEHLPGRAEKPAPLADRPEWEKSSSLPRVPSKSGFNLNSDISSHDNRLHSSPDMHVVARAIPNERVEVVVHPKTQSTSNRYDLNVRTGRNSLIAAASSNVSPSTSTPSHCEGKLPSSADEPCKAARHPSISDPESSNCSRSNEAADDRTPIAQHTVSHPLPADCNPSDMDRKPIVKPTVSLPEPADCNPSDKDRKPIVKPTVSVPEPADCNPCDDAAVYRKSIPPEPVEDKPREADRALVESSTSPPESAVCNPQDSVAYDGMSQGSAEMDCSDDDNATVLQIPTADNKLYADPLVKCKIGEDGQTPSFCPEVQKGHDSDTQQESSSSSATMKMPAQGLDGKSGDGKTTDAFATTNSKQCVNDNTKGKQLVKSEETSVMDTCDLHEAKISTGFSSTELRGLEASTSSPKVELAKQSLKTSYTLEKSRSPEPKPKRSRSPSGKRAPDSSECDAKHTKIESEEGARESRLPLNDSAEDAHHDGAASTHMHGQLKKMKSASERSEHENSKPNSFRTLSLQNERERQVDKPNWQDAGYSHVNRNERWERFVNSERETNNEDCQGGRHGSNMANPRRPRHGHVPFEHRNPKNFRGSRMGNDTEIGFPDDHTLGRRRPTAEDEMALVPRFPRRRRSPPMNHEMPGCVMREVNPDRFPGREMQDHIFMTHEHMEGLPDGMMEDPFFIPHPHLQYEHAEHLLERRERSLSPAQRRVVPGHFHRGRSPEVIDGHLELMRRSPPMIRMGRHCSPHRRPFHRDIILRRHGSPPLDRLPNGGRGMPRNMRRFGMIGSEEALDENAFGPPLHAQLPELPVEEAELMERRNFEERGLFGRPMAQCPFGDREEMLNYHHPIEGELPRPARFDMVFPDGGGPRDLDGRFRNRFRNRLRGAEEQEEGYRCRGPQGWRDGNANGHRMKRRRY